jgi:hypothetical protein
MSLLLDNPSHSAGEESQDNGEYDHQSPLTWKGIDIDDNKMAALKRVIEQIINSTDEVPDELVEAAKAILEVSSGINAIIIPLSPLLIWLILLALVVKQLQKKKGFQANHRPCFNFGHRPLAII